VQAGALGSHNAFISKFDPTGRTLLYSTYVGGSNWDTPYAIAVDSSGNLVGTGQTASTNFPLVNPIQSTLGGLQVSAFAFKLDATGSTLVYSTLLGGNGSAVGYGATLDAAGSAYITGLGSTQTTSGAVNACCAFVAKLSSTGTEVYAALLGGDQGNAIAVDANGAAYVAGSTTNVHPFAGNPPGVQQKYAGGGDAFVAKLSPDGSSLVWATLLGGSGSDSANAIALGAGDVVYFGGQTSSSDLPVTAGVAQGTYGGGTDAFVASLSAGGNSFGFVTYLGGGRSDTLASLAAGANGLIAAGNTYSRDFPVSAALQPKFPGPSSVFVKSTDSGASLTPADSGLPNTYYGNGPLPDPSTAGVIVLDTNQGVYRTADDGATWVKVLSSSWSTARSLSNPSILYTSSGFNLYKSIDGGKTWSLTYTGSSAYDPVVGIGPTDSNTVLLMSNGTEYRSTDGGKTFRQQVSAPITFILGLEQSVWSSPDGSMYVTTGFGSTGLFKSTDVGLTWAKLTNGVPGGFLPGFAIAASNPSILYASDGSNVYKSTNAGGQWTEVGTGAGVRFVAVDPANPQTVYGVGYYGVRISTDGGATWKPGGATFDGKYYNSRFAVSPTNAGEVYLSSMVPQNGFVAKLSTDGKTLVWSTYYGSYGGSALSGAALAPAGDVWVAGAASDGSLPLTPDARNDNTYSAGTAFLARIADATAPCSYTIRPETQFAYSEYSSSTFAFVLSVTAPSGCAWTATPSDDWIHPIRDSGTGSGTVPLAVDANTTASTRTGTVSVNGHVYTIVQPASNCTYQLSSSTPASAGGTVTITVTAPAGCPWDVEFESSDPATLTSAATGTGNGTVTISIPPNFGWATPGYTVVIGGQYFTVRAPAVTQPKISGVISAGDLGRDLWIEPGVHYALLGRRRFQRQRRPHFS
jgi:hypothetical protein